MKKINRDFLSIKELDYLVKKYKIIEDLTGKRIKFRKNINMKQFKKLDKIYCKLNNG